MNSHALPSPRTITRPEQRLLALIGLRRRQTTTTAPTNDRAAKRVASTTEVIQMLDAWATEHQRITERIRAGQ